MARDFHKMVESVFAEQLNIETPSRDTDLIGEGYMDSLLLVELIMALEQEFDITIPLDQLDFGNFQTINGIAAFVASQTLILETA